MSIKYAAEIIKEISDRGLIQLPESSATGEEFEKWLRSNYHNNIEESESKGLVQHEQNNM